MYGMFLFYFLGYKQSMPLIGPTLKSKFKDTILSALKKEFGSSELDPSLVKIASAVSEIAADIVDALHNDAMVAPGISIVGVGGGIPGPVSGATVAPGKIL
jgi:hypothetical protein